MSPAKKSLLPSSWPVAPANAQHMGKRDSQQDAFGFSNFDNLEFAEHGGYLAVLADGMGGMANGFWASSQAVRVFINAYQAKTITESPAIALLRSIKVANGLIYEEAKRLRLVDRMGTTLVAAVVRDSELHWVSSGDSRVYLFEAGQLSCLTTDHNYAEILKKQVVSGVISLTEAQKHPMRNALTSYLGRPEPLQVDTSTVPLRISSGAWVLLCSDGLSGVLSEVEISTNLYGDPQHACERLLRSALDHGLSNQDNTTVVILHVPTDGQVSHAYSRSIAQYTEFSKWSKFRYFLTKPWNLAAGVFLLMTIFFGLFVGLSRVGSIEDKSNNMTGSSMQELPLSVSTSTSSVHQSSDLGLASSRDVMISIPKIGSDVPPSNKKSKKDQKKTLDTIITPSSPNNHTPSTSVGQATGVGSNISVGGVSESVSLTRTTLSSTPTASVPVPGTPEGGVIAVPKDFSLQVNPKHQ